MGESSRKYENGKIYCIKNYIDNDTYVGHTTQALSKRMDAHRSACKDPKKSNARLYQKMNKLGIDNFYISLLQKCPCDDIEELRAKEGEWIETVGNLNVNLAGKTPQEQKEIRSEKKKEKYINDIEYQEKAKQRNKERWENKKEEIKIQQKQYRDEHKEEAKEYKKKYNEEHKEELKEVFSQYYQEHRQEKIEYNKKYREEHKEQDKARRSTIHHCRCGKTYTQGNKSRHFRTQFHKDYLNNINIENVSSTQEETNNTELQKADEQTNRESIGTGDI